MPVTVKIDALDRDIAVIFREDLSPEGRSAALAGFARDQLADSETTNERALGYVPPVTTVVDGREGAQPESVKPDGVIVFEFNLLEDLFAWIGEELVKHAPVGGGKDKHAGLFARSFIFLADGQQVDPGAPAPQATEYVFVNSQPYARKLEQGASPQAPDGVFEAVATMASRRFGNLARIRFAYRPLVGGATALEHWASHTTLARKRRGVRDTEWNRRQPAIVITLR